MRAFATAEPLLLSVQNAWPPKTKNIGITGRVGTNRESTRLKTRKLSKVTGESLLKME